MSTIQFILIPHDLFIVSLPLSLSLSLSLSHIPMVNKLWRTKLRKTNKQEEQNFSTSYISGNIKPAKLDDHIQKRKWDITVVC